MATYGISLDNYLLTHQNHDVIMFSCNVFEKSHSDSDGDHSAIYTPLGVKGQRLMREFVLSDVCIEEHEWTHGYVQGEYDADDALIDRTGKLRRIPYQLYDVPLRDYEVNRENVNSYGTYFFQALEAKQNIGSATNDGWIFAMILEAYRNYAVENNYEFVTETGDSIPMIRLDNKKFFKYHFTYIRGLQDFVVTGVKHNDAGSKDFESIFLRNIAQEKNSKMVRDILQGPLELNSKEASDILRIVTWAEMSGVRKACSFFLKLYNKGNEPFKDEDKDILKKYEAFIQKNTYFGLMIKPLYDIIYYYEHASQIAEKKMQSNVSDLIAQAKASVGL